MSDSVPQPSRSQRLLWEYHVYMVLFAISTAIMGCLVDTEYTVANWITFIVMVGLITRANYILAQVIPKLADQTSDNTDTEVN